jgi:hypothetical protein
MAPTCSNTGAHSAICRCAQRQCPQQNDLAGPDHKALSILTLDSDTKVALDDVVIKDQMRRWPESRPAMLGRDARRYAPRRKEIGVQEHAAGQMRHPQDIG